MAHNIHSSVQAVIRQNMLSGRFMLAGSERKDLCPTRHRQRGGKWEYEGSGKKKEPLYTVRIDVGETRADWINNVKRVRGGMVKNLALSDGYLTIICLTP